MKKIAVIQGIPRKKENPSLNPGDPLEIDKRQVRHTIRYYPPVGVVGYPGSGRKTLAHRFKYVKKGPFTEEVPVKNVYGDHILLKLDDESQGKFGFCLLLKLYIINPSTLSPDTPPLYLQDWNEFSCTIIVFDVNDKKTFYAVPSYLRILREPHFNIQDNFFIVGNKSDLREFEVRRFQVSERSARRMTSRLGGTYYECSAKQDVGVYALKCDVRICSLAWRYVVE